MRKSSGHVYQSLNKLDSQEDSEIFDNHYNKSSHFHDSYVRISINPKNFTRFCEICYKHLTPYDKQQTGSLGSEDRYTHINCFKHRDRLYCFICEQAITPYSREYNKSRGKPYHHECARTTHKKSKL